MEPVTTNQMLFIGLCFLGWSSDKLVNSLEKSIIAGWKSHFIPSPTVCSLVYQDLIHVVPGNTKIKLSQFLMLIFWLSHYPTQAMVAQRWKISEKTCWKHIKCSLTAIQALKAQKIKWIWDTSVEEEVFLMTVDGTHCRISEPRTQPSSNWYSHKFAGPGLACEVAISIF